MRASPRSAADSPATRRSRASELKDAIIAQVPARQRARVLAPQILVSTGAKQTIYNMVMAVLNPGDEAVIPAPYWVSYPDMVLLADGVPVMPYAGPEHGYKITPAQLEAAITPRTRLLILNSPNNPTGAAYTKRRARGPGRGAAASPAVLICTDDMYEHIYWGDRAVLQPGYGGAGVVRPHGDGQWRVEGYAMTAGASAIAAARRKIIEAMATIQSQSTTNRELDRAEGRDRRAARRPVLRGRDERPLQGSSDFFIDGLNRLPGFSCLPGAGTFYAFADVERAMAALGCRDDDAFAEHLLVNAGVAVVPGTGFGAPGPHPALLRLQHGDAGESARSACAVAWRTEPGENTPVDDTQRVKENPRPFTVPP